MSVGHRYLTSLLRPFGPRIPGWFPLVVERVAPVLVPGRGVRDATVLGSRMSLDLDEYMQRRFYFHCYEGPEVRFVQRWLRPGDTVVDVGAHVGLFTLLAARCVSATGHVHAFEPVPATFGALERNVSQNGYDWVTLHRAAVMDEVGVVSLGLEEERLVGVSSSDFTIGGGLAQVQAPAVTLDAALGECGSVRLLKIDAEGFEPQVLHGATRLLEVSPPDAILLEVNHKLLRRHGASSTDLIALLHDHGYRLRRLDRRGKLAPAPSSEQLAAAAAELEARGEPRSKLLVGWRTRRTMFNAVAIRTSDG